MVPTETDGDVGEHFHIPPAVVKRRHSSTGRTSVTTLAVTATVTTVKEETPRKQISNHITYWEVKGNLSLILNSAKNRRFGIAGPVNHPPKKLFHDKLGVRFFSYK